jgi:hypothetical protein
MIIIKSDNHILQEEAMIQTITATDAVRNFSELLNNIRYRGERYTILKGESRRRPSDRRRVP